MIRLVINRVNDLEDDSRSLAKENRKKVYIPSAIIHCVGCVMIHSSTLIEHQFQTDRQTDGHTDRRTDTGPCHSDLYTTLSQHRVVKTTTGKTFTG